MVSGAWPFEEPRRKSNQSMAGRGGRRPGAGRKAGQGNRLTAIKRAAPEIKSIKESKEIKGRPFAEPSC